MFLVTGKIIVGSGLRMRGCHCKWTGTVREPAGASLHPCVDGMSKKPRESFFIRDGKIQPSQLNYFQPALHALEFYNSAGTQLNRYIIQSNLSQDPN